jgi:hypothetical protein
MQWPGRIRNHQPGTSQNGRQCPEISISGNDRQLYILLFAHTFDLWGFGL